MLKEENWEIAKPQEWMPRTTLPTELLPRWRPPKLVWLRTTGSQICEAVEHWLERELDWEFLTTSIFQTQLAGCPLALP